MAERPTPVSIAICTLITLYSDPSLDSLLLLEELVSISNENTMLFSELLSKIKVDFEISDKLLNILKIAAESIDGLIDLFDSFRVSLNGGSVDGCSVFGIYIRKRCLGFDELPFEGLGRLWKSFLSYIKEDKKDNSWVFSSRDVERALFEQCLTIEKEVGKFDFEEVESKYHHLLENNPELPVGHFCTFLNCLFHKERVGAMESLHRYFDYAVIRERRGVTENFKRTSVMQYAAILLAAMHFEFGDENLSLKATEEAILVAHQSADQECLKATEEAILVAHQRGSEYSSKPSEELLRTCASRALEHNLFGLYSGALFALAKYYMTIPYHGPSPHFDPAFIWDHLNAASTMFETNSISVQNPKKNFTNQSLPR